MADQKVSDLPSLNGADVDAADLLYIIDSSAGSAGSKKITVGQYQLAPVSGGTANGVAYLNASKVATAGSDLVFDGSNLGLGVTPSAWSNFKAIQINTASNGAVAAPYLQLTSNAYFNGTNWIYTETGAATRFDTRPGGNAGFAWHIANSGTAGNAITFTQAMTLDASGNLSVGTTAGGTRLQVFTATDNVEYFRAGTSAESRGIRFSSFIVSGTNGVGHLIDAPGASGVNGTLAFATNSTERARITSEGELLVGTTATTGGRATISAVANYGDLATGYSVVLANSAGTGSNANPINVGVIQFGNPTLTNNDMGRLSVVQENPGAGTQSYMRFFTNGGGGNAQTLERARITSAGDFLVGQTGAFTEDIHAVRLEKAIGNVVVKHATGTASSSNYSLFMLGSSQIGSITQNGTTAVAYNTTSDRRLKENIVPAPSASAAIDAIEIVSHDWKAAPDEHVTYGVIAQDLALVAPQAVLQGDDGDEIEKTWGVDYSKLVPMLIKEIQTLRARVAALESA